MEELASKKTKQIMTLEEEMLNIEESKIPGLISDRVKKIESINKAYLIARKKADNAKNKVNEAIDNANILFEKAERTGNHSAPIKKLLWHEYQSTADEIDAIKQNVKELVQLEEESAEGSKEIASILGTFTESQMALLEVQRAQGEYQMYIADVSKFLFGLCAYNQASIQSILQNLVKTLKGSSKEKLGALAEQQLMLAIDQMKNQENIIVQLKKNKEEISKIRNDKKAIEEELKEIQVHCKYQDRLIEEGKTKGVEITQRIEEGEKHDLIQDQKIIEGAERDKWQDEQLEDQKQKCIEYDQRITEGEERDNRQDEQLEEQKQKDLEHDRRLQAVEEHNKRQDNRLNNQDLLNAEYESQIHALEDQIKALADRNNNLQSALDDFKAEIANKGVDKWTIVAGSIGVVSVILAVIALIV